MWDKFPNTEVKDSGYQQVFCGVAVYFPFQHFKKESIGGQISAFYSISESKSSQPAADF